MGLIHSRARKKRDRAEAALMREQTRQARQHPATVGALIGELLRRRRTRKT